MLGVDLGATNVRVALANVDGKILLKKSEKTIGESGSAVVGQIIEMGFDALNSVGLRKGDVKAVGIGSIGPLDLKRGLIVNPPNLRVGVIPIVEGIADSFNVPVRLLNDCVAAVLGEKRFGAGKDLDNVVYVTISTGIGGGVMVDGHLLLGKDGNAHEVGHIVIDKEGTLQCGCGKWGHWEAYCGGRGMLNYSKMLLKGWGTHLFNESLLASYCENDFSKITSELLFKAAKEKDNLALRIIEEIGRINAIGFSNIIDMYDPELITVGGSVALHNSELILKPIQEYLSKYAMNRLPEIRITTLGEDVVLYGALAATAFFR
ncbi:MAG: ROK family protein [Thermoproteota archaeon]